MGGNALKHLNVRRVSKQELAMYMEEFVEMWEQQFIDPDMPLWYFNFPLPLGGKEDFGDLDVVFWCEPKDVETVLAGISKHFNSKGSKKNGGVTSIEWNGLQVDMIYENTVEKMEWASNWYSHGDTMALLGRVYRYYRFVLKNNGLYFSVKTSNFREDLPLNQDWKTSLNLLGYKQLSRFVEMTEEDSFEFVLSSDLAFPAVYLEVKPERPLKRPMQLKFYAMLEALDDETRTTVHHKRSLGWKLLYQLDKKLFWQAVRKKVELLGKEVVLPPKRVYKKVWNKTLKPRVYRLLGKELNRSKRNARDTGRNL